MKLETITVSPDQERVLIMFEQNDGSEEDDEVRSYLTSKGLEPRRQYMDTRDENEYEVYYFGHCYIEKHLDKLTGMAVGD